ncbi:MAG: CHAT domain-containing protein [Bacteroidales bacterium]|nr:CHAT domain-containing protein [Bacteroidales bacterium]
MTDAEIDFRIASISLMDNLFTIDPNNITNIDDLVNSVDNFCKYFHLFCRDILPTLTTTERATFYQGMIAPIIADVMPHIIQIAESFRANHLMYQFLLDTRGLQLKCNRTFADIVKKYGTDKIKTAFDKYIHQKSVLKKAETSEHLTQEKYAEIKRDIDNLNRKLLDWQKDSGHDILGWMNTYVDHIQSKLEPDEIAIETFIYDLGDGNRWYCGLAATNDKTGPILFDIISESDFKALESTPQILGKKVWEDFFEYMPELRRIYFVPCGRMVNFPIELCTDSLYASKDVEIIRLSSTREILDSDKKIPQKIHAFGVTEYNDDIFPDLPGARKEVKDLASLFPKNSRTIRLDTEATESEFKKLSGTSAELIHVAAHGYYNNPGNRAENALANCGLVLSEYTNENVENEDGLLSGEEISTMNLANVDMVTLSSCNSGNAIATEEGAYGLQRAFKLAGVKSILMSLREVKDDGPTKIFMHNFYKSYKSDGDKYKAYRSAVKAVRKRYSGIADWGAFVLIDP